MVTQLTQLTQADAIIIAARRTPVGRAGGLFKSLSVEQLMAPVLQSLLQDTGLQPDQVDEVILGNAIGPGGNPARLALLEASFPTTIPGLSIDRQCGSGLEAIHLAARLVQSGAGHCYIAGGMESVSTAPWRVEKPRSLYELPHFANRARFAPDALGDPDMGVAAEAVAQRYGISRDRQDEYAYRSHQKALNALETHRFQAEIVPVPLSSVTGCDRDECPRPKLTQARLAKLPPVFQADGTVTAGNSCPINDGAAAVVVVSRQLFDSLRLFTGLRFIDAVAVGVDPNYLGIGPVPAVQALLKRQSHIQLNDIDLIEFNEAFAAQVLACVDALNLPQAKMNIGGGAIALGHPYGASGAILVTRLFSEMICPVHPPTRPFQLGLATLGIGGGLGLASLFEAIR